MPLKVANSFGTKVLKSANVVTIPSDSLYNPSGLPEWPIKKTFSSSAPSGSTSYSSERFNPVIDGEDVWNEFPVEGLIVFVSTTFSRRLSTIL